jgi:hypothetical protein
MTTFEIIGWHKKMHCPCGQQFSFIHWTRDVNCYERRLWLTSFGLVAF